MRTNRALVASLAPLLALVLLAGGCSQKASSGKELTQRQRDSILGTEPIPGASTVTRALSESDKAAAAAGRTDAQVDSMPR